MISFTVKSSYKTDKYLRKLSANKLDSILQKYGKVGVDALMHATPIDSGKTAQSWDYEIEYGDGSATIVWTNSNINDNVSIAMILQYGHGTGTGGYVQGIDYINPAMRPVFDNLAKDAWEEVTRD